MNPVTIGPATLYFGDSLEIMPKLDPHDHVITDPPYESFMHSAKSGSRGIRSDGRKSPAALNFSCINPIRDVAAALMAEKSKGWLLAFCTPEGVARWADAINALPGARYKRAMPWIKPDAAPQFNGQGPAMACEMIVAAWCGKGVSRWNRGGKRGYYIELVNPTSRMKVENEDGSRTAAHPTEKPVSLMRALLADFTTPEQTILDPFMGIGSTGAAALMLGRKFTGIEKDRVFFDRACRRLEEVAESVERDRESWLFTENDKKMKQADFFS